MGVLEGLVLEFGGLLGGYCWQQMEIDLATRQRAAQVE